MGVKVLGVGDGVRGGVHGATAVEAGVLQGDFERADGEFPGNVREGLTEASSKGIRRVSEVWKPGVWVHAGKVRHMP